MAQQFSSLAESAAKTKHKLTKHRDAVQIWAAFAIVLGLGLAMWSASVIRAQMPAQDTPVAVESQSPVPSESPSASASPAPSATPSSSPAGAAEVPARLYPSRPKFGSKIGTITLPTLSLSWPVYEGTNNTQLAKGVGHYRGSVLPGIRDNSVLSGHRTTVFNRLGELKKGDLIRVKTSAGIFTYKVRKFRIVKRTDRTVIVPTKTAVLTLTTCYPFDSIGSTTRAFIVTADLVSSKLAAVG